MSASWVARMVLARSLVAPEGGLGLDLLSKAAMLLDAKASFVSIP